MAGEKTEKATPKKVKDERKKGNAFQSKDVVSVVILFVGFFLTSQLVPFIYLQVKNFFFAQMDKIADTETLTVISCNQMFREVAKAFFISALPIMLIIGFCMIIMVGAQTGFLVSGELLKPKFNKINPFTGIKRLFSLRSLVELAKSIMKVTLILVAIYTTIKSLIPLAPDMMTTELAENAAFLMNETMSMVKTICMIFVVVAILDFAYQKYDYNKKLKMEKQEIKDEYKQTEGDPRIKGQRRNKQREMSMNRMMAAVPEADVIVRNPTHYAVALKYDMDKDVAPIIIAKGKDHIAFRIIEIGEKNRVPIQENRPLARGLYEIAEINDYVPAELYKAVAELMAWVYSNKKKEK
ncbi:flagellar biosynthesis protein FlhB [Acetobacterium paludosum]|uniref:Flagellar biosynthetic protein FlhB n=1 Tax=Acetobacterium paludosum TaxID=52693 RepID=A0A923HZ36_9FIRM|nr:flagellar biosynthesis protein FlhB [Acetobacterium paludosum]MBC3888641.1 flagellar biosynthesis protein FlhB [Acetobacterium paludosum]